MCFDPMNVGYRRFCFPPTPSGSGPKSLFESPQPVSFRPRQYMLCLKLLHVVTCEAVSCVAAVNGPRRHDGSQFHERSAINPIFSSLCHSFIQGSARVHNGQKTEFSFIKSVVDRKIVQRKRHCVV